MEQIKKIVLREKAITQTQFEVVQFVDCDFSNASLGNHRFVECEFVNCNFTLCSLQGTSFQDVVFKGCKLLGARFDQCSKFALSFQFENCILDHAVFHELKISKTKFSGCRMTEVDFTGAELKAAVFVDCELGNAVFERSNLESADLRGAQQLALDPKNNSIKKARFTLEQLPGLLLQHNIKIN